MTTADENLETEHVANLSCRVESSRVVLAVCTRPSAVMIQFTILQGTCDCRRKLETGSRLATAAFTPPTRRNSTSLSANCSDSSRLSPTSCEFNTHRRCNCTGQLSCVGGVYWALGPKVFRGKFCQIPRASSRNSAADRGKIVQIPRLSHNSLPFYD